MSKCRSCGADIVWVEMRETGKKMPIDSNSIKKMVVLNNSRTMGAILDAGVSHFSTCPNANKHRKRGDK